MCKVNIHIERLLRLSVFVSPSMKLARRIVGRSAVHICRVYPLDGWITSQNISNSYVRCVRCIADPSLHDKPLHSLLRDVWQLSHWLYSTTLLYLFSALVRHSKSKRLLYCTAMCCASRRHIPSHFGIRNVVKLDFPITVRTSPL
jgi:hypothetical protein